MKKKFKSTAVRVLAAALAATLLLPLTALGAVKEREDEVVWSNMNPAAVSNGPRKKAAVVIDEAADPVAVHRISTYHWNNGAGSVPGTISVLEDREELGTWKAEGHGGSGAENVYWTVDVDLIFYPGHTYTIKDSDPDTWSWNSESGKAGMCELYGLDPAPEETSDSRGKAEAGCTPEDITVYLDGEEAELGADTEGPAGVIVNGELYLPAIPLIKLLGFEAQWEKAKNALFIGTKPDNEDASHCWVLRDSLHEVDDDYTREHRTWKYDWEEIEGGERYLIDYTWHYNDEYAHYLAVAECTDIPATLFPGAYAYVNLKTYATDVVGNPGVWGIPVMTYITYHFNEGHYPSGYDITWSNVNEDEPADYNCSDGAFEWTVKAKFPEGEPGETLEVGLWFHRGDEHPVKTTWVYEWKD